ncbi:hypothetical protein V2G26_005390 [Clonostachys chloroleuca]
MRPGPSSTADLTAVIHLLLFSHLRTVIPLSLLQILRTTYIHPLLGPPPPPHHYTSVASTPFLQKNLLYSDSFSHGRFSAESQLAAAGAVARLGQDLAVRLVRWLQPNFPTIPPASHLARICETTKYPDHENIGKMIPLT